MKCVYCDNEANYDSPEDLCEEHWIDWFVTNQSEDHVQLSPEEQEWLRQELENMITEKYHGGIHRKNDRKSS